jgi:hypothetical protein
LEEGGIDMSELNLSADAQRRLLQWRSLLLSMAGEAEENAAADSVLCEGHESATATEANELTRLDNDTLEAGLGQMKSVLVPTGKSSALPQAKDEGPSLVAFMRSLSQDDAQLHRLLPLTAATGQAEKAGEVACQFQIECIQTISDLTERERRLKLAFDVILNFGRKKAAATPVVSEAEGATAASSGQPKADRQ